MKYRIVCALTAGSPALALAGPGEDQVKQLEQQVKTLQALATTAIAARQKDAHKINALGARLEAGQVSSVKAPPSPQADGDDAPAQLTRGEIGNMKAQLANAQLKVDGLNGDGIDLACLAVSITSGTECHGANRMAFTGTLLASPTTQITLKSEDRHDIADLGVDQKLDGDHVKSNDVFSLQFTYAC